MNLKTLCHSVGDVLYGKGLIGHITIDLVSFPNPTDPKGHPLFWAIDINAELTDFAAITLFFDILMEGQLDQETGQYDIEVMKDATPTAPSRSHGSSCTASSCTTLALLRSSTRPSSTCAGLNQSPSTWKSDKEAPSASLTRSNLVSSACSQSVFTENWPSHRWSTLLTSSRTRLASFLKRSCLMASRTQFKLPTS
jgi:hypothetical protein